MIKHVTEWLGAYHDGELHGARLHQVEQHLVECATCQAELDEIRSLSALLHETKEGDFLSAERFAANLSLNMPRRPVQDRPRSMLNIGWWLAPVSLLGVWLFVNITISMGSLLSFAVNAGLIGHDAAWLKGNALQMNWYSAATNLFGSQLGAPGHAALTMMNDAQLFLAQLVGSLLPQIVLAVLYLGWLFSWWLRHQAQAAQISSSFFQS
jgi:anti-sigma factor RsiW